MNPCRCGYLGEGGRECGRAPRCGEDYQNRVSGPVLDRIDLAVDVQPASAAELSLAPPGEASAVIAGRVARARRVQTDRYGADGPLSNAEADGRLIRLQPDAQKLLEQAMERLRLSPRGYTVPCASRARSPISPAPRWSGASTWPRHWPTGIGLKRPTSFSCRDRLRL